MPRPFTKLTALIAVLASSLGSPLNACHSGRHLAVRYPISAHRHVRVVQPVTIVRPAMVRPAIAPVQVVAALPQPPRENLPTVPAGATLTLPANFLGHELGSVFMVFNEIKLPVQVHQWATTGVTITLPPMAIKDAVVIRLDIVLPNGNLGLTQQVRVTAPAPVVLHPVGPTSPLPTSDALQQAAEAQRPRVTAPRVIPGAPLPVFGQPVVHPASPAGTTSAVVAPPVPGSAAGTPGSPIVLPPAQPAAATLPGTVENNEDPLANNPILSEHQSGPADVPAPPIEQTVEEATGPAPELDDEAAGGGVLSAIARALTAQLRP